MEMPILLLLAEMERNGVHINSEYLGGLTAEEFLRVLNRVVASG